MILSNLQNQALTAIKQWLTTNEPVFYLAGFAGTGKTTLLAVLDQEISSKKIYCAYTGKATHNLKKRGLKAVTLDKLIYYHVKVQNLTTEAEDWRRLRHGEELILSDDEVIRAGKIDPEPEILNSRLIIVDECSMISESYMQDLLAYNKKILVVGDPAQLDPVQGAGYFAAIQPNFLLNEIHRQAADSGIIQLATSIRENRFRGYTGFGDEVQLIKALPEMDSLDWNETQFISRSHDIRFKYNRFIRMKYYGAEVSPLPEAGDKLICLRNSPENNIFNGQQVFVAHYQKPTSTRFTHGVLDAIDLDTDTEMSFKANNEILSLYASMEHIKEQTELVKNANLINREHVPLDYGYCITCHKAQGSQWDTVYLPEPSPYFQTQLEKNKWLYTAVTRAAKQLFICSK
jgi:exodeoxyribonuclease-5